MFPSSSYLKDLAFYSKLTKDLFNFVPYKYKNDVVYYNLFHNLDKVLDKIGYEAIVEATSGKTNFKVVLFSHCSFLMFDQNKKSILPKKTKEILHKKINKIVVSKSEIILSILSRYEYNVVLEILDDETGKCSKQTYINFNLED